MSRSFAIALLVPALALARGDNSGYGRQNAMETVLVEKDNGEVLKLYTYNALNDGVPELHARWRQFGFCLNKNKAEENWDCLQVRVDLGQEVFISPAMTFTDMHAPLTFGDFVDSVNDFNAQDPAISWVNIAAKSSIDCTPQSNATLATLSVASCEKVDAHFYRNFVTFQKDEDLQLTADMVDHEFDVVGFSLDSQRATYDPLSQYGDAAKIGTDSKKIKLVFQATKDALDALEPADAEVDPEQAEQDVVTYEELCGWIGGNFVYNSDSGECLLEPDVTVDLETDWLKDLCESFAIWGGVWKDGECVYPERLSLKEATTKTESEENAGSGSIFLGFGVGASTVAAAWALCHVGCAKNTKKSALEPLL